MSLLEHFTRFSRTLGGGNPPLRLLLLGGGTLPALGPGAVAGHLPPGLQAATAATWGGKHLKATTPFPSLLGPGAFPFPFTPPPEPPIQLELGLSV